ncbi:MAG: hypothetical protein U1A27_11370 [Phycisphaerae bacterium]
MPGDSAGTSFSRSAAAPITGSACGATLPAGCSSTRRGRLYFHADGPLLSDVGRPSCRPCSV